MTPTKLAVIGVGVMGRNYLRAAKAAGIEISAIYDINADHVEAAAAEYGCKIIADPNFAHMTAAVIAVPTAAHAGTAGALLKRGVHCLVEKPFAATESECRALIETAAINNLVLQVGHVERFNPAIVALRAKNIDPAAITAISARRMGPASERITDVSVVVDLMVHDLDIVRAFKPMAVTRVEASGDRDHAEATLTFSDGTTAALTASRTSATRVRELYVTTPGATYHLDYIAKSLTGDTASETLTGDALGAEISHFLGCIQASRQPDVTGEQALEVMKLAWRIEAALALTSKNAA